MNDQDFQFNNSKDYSLSFLEYTLDVIISNKWLSSRDLYEKIFNKGKSIIKTFGKETPLFFVILKVLKIIRVECARVLSGNPELEEQATNLLFAEPEMEVKEVMREDLQEYLSEAISELTLEVKEARNMLNESAANHILSNDVLLVYGYSEIIFDVLKFAKQQRNCFFTVIVLDGYPFTGAGHMVNKLSALNIQVTLAPERASLTLLAKCHKVLLESDTAYADGGILGRLGHHRICLDAKVHSVPVYVCLPSFRLYPLISPNFNNLLPISHSSDDSYNLYKSDLISAELVNTVVTNVGSFHPAQLMSVAKDCFCSEDVRDFLSKIN